MIKKILTILFAFSLGLCLAQQDAQYSQYMFNGLVLNPAFAGSGASGSIAGFVRSQWTNFTDHPVTQSISYNQPLFYGKGGFGVHLQNDKIGLEQKTSILSAWAYRIHTEKSTLSFGLQAGFQTYTINQNKLDTKDKDDQTFYPEIAPTLLPDIGFGVYYKRKDYYVGFSIPHLLQTQININNYQSNLDIAKLYRHYFITAAYRYKLNRDFDLIPSILTKYTQNTPLSVDITTHIMFQDKLWGGTTYRVGDSFSFQLGTNLKQMSRKFSEQIKIGYAFDLTTSSFRAYNNGTHEIMLIYDFNNSNAPMLRTPRFRY